LGAGYFFLPCSELLFFVSSCRKGLGTGRPPILIFAYLVPTLYSGARRSWQCNFVYHQ
jgi:hypothetical protein